MLDYPPPPALDAVDEEAGPSEALPDADEVEDESADDDPQTPVDAGEGAQTSIRPRRAAAALRRILICEYWSFNPLMPEQTSFSTELGLFYPSQLLTSIGLSTH